MFLGDAEAPVGPSLCLILPRIHILLGSKPALNAVNCVNPGFRNGSRHPVAATECSAPSQAVRGFGLMRGIGLVGELRAGTCVLIKVSERSKAG